VAQRIRRTVALVLYYGVATRLPDRGPLAEPSRWIRQELCRAFLEHTGERVNIGSRVYLGAGTSIRIGNRSGLGRDCRIYGGATIGDEVMFGPSVTVLSSNHRFENLDEPIGWQGFGSIEPPVIEDGAWIGVQAIILPGRVVGSGAIVGAGSVVTHDVAPLAIVGGNPAVVIGSRESTSG
jgi:acetyltransferase-like isoleucine patch superfamily enzyme